MSPDEAREHFSEAFEGELDSERRAAFDDAIAKDAELAQEYGEFVETFRMVGRMGEPDSVEAPDLLLGVQERLRKRSRGRYYRDRFSRRAGPAWALPVLLAAVSILVIALAYYAVHSAVILEDPTTIEAPAGPGS